MNLQIAQVYFLQDHRRLAINKGQSVNDEVIIEMFKKDIKDDHNNKPRTKLYKQEVLTAMKKSWPELYSADIAKISRKDCNEWAARYSKEYSPTRYNGALGIGAPHLRDCGRTWLPCGQSSQVCGSPPGEAEGIASAVAGAISGNGQPH
jgi:hypothetical protein